MLNASKPVDENLANGLQAEAKSSLGSDQNAGLGDGCDRLAAGNAEMPVSRAPDSRKVDLATQGNSFSPSFRKSSSSFRGVGQRSGLGLALDRPSLSKVSAGPMNVQSLLHLSSPDTAMVLGHEEPQLTRAGTCGSGDDKVPSSLASAAVPASAEETPAFADRGELAAQLDGGADPGPGVDAARSTLAARAEPTAVASEQHKATACQDDKAGTGVKSSLGTLPADEREQLNSPFARKSVQRSLSGGLKNPGWRAPGACARVMGQTLYLCFGNTAYWAGQASLVWWMASDP